MVQCNHEKRSVTPGNKQVNGTAVKDLEDEFRSLEREEGVEEGGACVEYDEGGGVDGAADDVVGWEVLDLLHEDARSDGSE
mmetsp:Transcript_16099/g.29174  ORF Transcript_16099/g.29174 Transcript_16099/m.29174 type:complete len:81 (+) Transcript_16099:483-725(+)